MSKKILVVDDEPEIVEALTEHLTDEGFCVVTAASGEEAIKRFKGDSFSLMITDMVMPGLSGLDLLKYVKGQDDDIEVIMLTAYGTLDNAIETLGKNGAFAYLRKPLEDLEDISVTVKNALAKRQLRLDKKRLSAELLKANSELEEKVEQRTAELKEMVQALSQAKEAAEAANMAKINFIGSMNHELKTPLHSIISFAYILMSELSGKQKEYAGHIEKSGQHLLALIEDVLDMSRVEMEDACLQVADLLLPATLQRCLSMLDEQARARNITFDVEVAPALNDLVVHADRAKVKQILFNLLANAIKFSDEGGTVSVAIKLTPEDHPPCVQVTITDTGIGLPLPIQEKIFAPFYQYGYLLTGKPAGAGLGLTIARYYAELHGGTLSVASKGEGQGCQFRLTLPLQDQGL